MPWYSCDVIIMVSRSSNTYLERNGCDQASTSIESPWLFFKVHNSSIKTSPSSHRTNIVIMISTRRHNVILCYICRVITRVSARSLIRTEWSLGSCKGSGVHYTWRAPQTSFRGYLFSRMEAIFLIMWHTLCSKLDDGPASTMRGRHLISDTNYTAAPSSWCSYHPRICTEHTKTRLGSSPFVVHHQHLGPVTFILVSESSPEILYKYHALWKISEWYIDQEIRNVQTRIMWFLFNTLWRSDAWYGDTDLAQHLFK